jgi:membrane fusion protein (multidrug efflux system)
MRQPPTPASQASPALAPATKPGPTPQGPNIHARASRLVLGLGLAAGLAAITGCNRNPATTASTGRNEPVPVTVATVTNAAWDRTVSIIGTLFPKDEAIIAARVEGQVEGTSVDFGDRVRNGQDIAAIDTTAYLAHLEQAVGIRARAEANLANARNNFDRVQRLQKSGIASDADFDLARSQLDQWQAEVKADAGAEAVARLNVDRSQVKAPFDGAVAERIVGRGDFVKVGSPLYRIVNDAVLKFIFQVPERHASLVEKRLPVSFNVDNYPGKTFTGSVYLISPSVSTASRSFGVGALVTNVNFQLKANSFARGELVLQKAVPTPVVPVDAIISFAGVTRVFVLDDQTARSRTVVTGRIRDGLQEILEGIQAGDRVIVSGQSRITDGQEVALRDATLARTTPGAGAGAGAVAGAETGTGTNNGTNASKAPDQPQIRETEAKP